MSLLHTVRTKYLTLLKNSLRYYTRQWRITRVLSPFLPRSVCVDVGASYYPHVKWRMFLSAPETQWLVVEPNEDNIGYVQNWEWPCQVFTCATGLSQYGLEHTLYITNVDTGSSLLEPEITPSMMHRVMDKDYYFPVTERSINTVTLSQAMEGLSDASPIFVKLDTQGTELSILKGAQEVFDKNMIIGIEMESTLLSQPVMKGSGKFWQACEFLESQGFELLDMKPIPGILKSGRKKSRSKSYLHECDAVYALRQDIAKDLPVDSRICLVAFYLTNQFYWEALSMLKGDSELLGYLKNKGCDINALMKLTSKAI